MRDSSPADLLRCGVGGRTIGLPAGIVRDIAEPAAVTPLPGAPAEVLGIAVLRGAPVTIVDGRRLAGEAADAPITAFVLCEVGGRRIGVAVDDVLGLGGDSAPFDLAARLVPLFGG